MRVFTIAVVLSFFGIVGCSSNPMKTWRAFETVVSPFPKWNVKTQSGGQYPELIHTHNLKRGVPVYFPKGFKWGIAYGAKLRLRPAKSHPDRADFSSRETYIVEKIIGESPVKTGKCFSFGGEIEGARENLSQKRFLELFQPNTATFSNSKVATKFDDFLQDKHSNWFRVQACFQDDLEIEIEDFRYDH